MRAAWRAVLREAAAGKGQLDQRLAWLQGRNAEAKTEADRHLGECQRRQAEGFRSFIRKGSEGSAALLHRLTKPLA
eukprot:8986779-Lingulodinium_polyedra.AAC.1